MHRLRRTEGQATLETLGLVPVVAAISLGLAACGAWIARCEQLRGAVAASAVAAMESGDDYKPGEGIDLLPDGTGLTGRSGSAAGGLGALLPAAVETIRWPAGAAGL